jgi:hypothetical protein
VSSCTHPTQLKIRKFQKFRLLFTSVSHGNHPTELFWWQGGRIMNRQLAGVWFVSAAFHAGAAALGCLWLWPTDALPVPTIDTVVECTEMTLTLDVEPSKPRTVTLPPVVVKPPAPAVLPESVETITLPLPSGSGTGPVQQAGLTEPATPSAPAKERSIVPSEIRSVVFILDRSGSMGLGGRLDAAKGQLSALLRQLPERTRFQVILYNRSAEVLCIAGSLGLVSSDPDHVRSVEALLVGLDAEGRSNHTDAVKQALRLDPEMIVVLSDVDAVEEDTVRRTAGRVPIRVVRPEQ